MAQKPITERRGTRDEEYEEIKDIINEIKAMLVSRQYIDVIVLENNKKLAELENGNGKIGFKAVRDKVIAWEKSGSAIALLIAGDIITRVVQLVTK